ncbi:putative protoheme IX farnesyltransferase [Trypanosoma rangeli]|uniref:Heme O synthase n=1 Tax=Trypanosoma rangeli TaxID=5698 RepID=A0A3R7KFR3_TRYRA|nr:putative protoheme IX farnesyltransferase [Trypanosoma rangeli]RNF05592.1 putative protoheme IX farnesyltransferase [Trypanosoma rangeli]|eukprot:RNF05592.1 putative protoheme IX farnesyltransferase [Trypanosoma rangeli]
MIRRAFFKGPRVRCLGAVAFQSRSNPVTKWCPFSGGLGTVETKPLATRTGTVTCPVMGVAPQLRCPMETEEYVRTLPVQQIVAQMGKLRLSAFVTATTVAGYVICGGTNPVVVAAITAGTLLQSCSANTANQIIEKEHDKKMKRTCRRPMPMGYITCTGASTLSAVELLAGSGILYLVSPPMASLGFFNWCLYVVVYTPLKRVSAINTWVGSIVGGIPPLMGGIAATGTVTGPAWLLGALLVAWQIPHFMGLSFHCRRDYQAAGYKMLAFYSPWRASFYAVLMSFAMAGMTLAGPALIGMLCEGWYYLAVALANGVMIYKAWLFHCMPKTHCRGCFVFSYIYLTIVLTALVVNHFGPVNKCTAVYEYVFTKLESQRNEVASQGLRELPWEERI